MAYRLYLSARAEREFQKLERTPQEQVVFVFESLQSDPFTANIKKLKRPFSGYRVRKGDYRILFTLERDTITVYSIKHRKDAYR